MAQLPGYLGNPKMLSAALIVIGIGVGRCTKKEFITSAVETIIDTADHNNAEHRRGAAKALGYISAYHPDLALEKLGLLSKGGKGGGGFFGSKNKNQKEYTEISRALAALGLCHAAQRIPASIFSSRLEASILPMLSSIIAETRSMEVRFCAYESIQMLDQPVQKATEYSFKVRDGFIEALLADLEAPFKNPKVIPNTDLLKLVTLGLSAITSLVDATANPPLAAAPRDRTIAFVLSLLPRIWVGADNAQDEEKFQASMCTTLVAIFNNIGKADLDNLLTPLHSQTAQL